MNRRLLRGVFLLQGVSLLSLPRADARPGPAPIVAKRMDGPYENPQQLCARARRDVCEEIRFPERDHKSKCKVADRPVNGSLSPEFLAAQTVTAHCDNGDTLDKTLLVIKTKAGWFRYSDLPNAGFQHHTEELLDIKSIDAQKVGDASLLTLKAQYSCNQTSGGGDERYMYSRTLQAELLLMIGIGASGRPSVALQPIGSALMVNGLGDSEKVRDRMLWEDSVKQPWSLLPGPLLQLDAPQVTQGAKNKKVLPTDEEEPLCYDGSLGKRRAKRCIGSACIQCNFVSRMGRSAWSTEFMRSGAA